MLEVFEQLASGNAKGGFPLSRIVSQMDWAAEGRSHVENLVEFESRVNDVWRRHDDVLLSAIRHAIECSRTALDHESEMQALRDCYGSLTRREREVMALVVSGRLNKQIGGELDISEITVKAHRGQVMQR